MVKKFLLLSFASFALAFSPMGNVSTSLGGAGVALRNSAWGLYYNPALLASDPRSKFSFNIGLGVSKNNLNPILEIPIDIKPNELTSLFESLKDPQANLSVQMGVVAQIGGFTRDKTIALPDEYGRLVSQTTQEKLSAFAIGAFANSQVSVSFESIGGGGYQARSLGVVLMEIPIGYGYQLATSFGDFNFGVALKFMSAVFDFSSYVGNAYNGVNIRLPDFFSQTPSYNFGIDLGFLYSIADVHIGLSAKNITLPSFKNKEHKFTLDPSLKFGLSYEFLQNYVLAMDVDLLPESFSGMIPKSQMLGIGVMGDYHFVDFRVGVGVDMLSPTLSKLTAGVNVFGILDLVGELGFNFVKKADSKVPIPTNFGFKIGSTFTF